MEDKIDPAGGFMAEVKIGDELRAGDLMGLVYCGDADSGQRTADRIRAAYVIDDAPPAEMPVLIKEVID
jgi:thymidine phosphorylase